MQRLKRLFALLLALLLTVGICPAAGASESSDIISAKYVDMGGEDFSHDELNGVKAYPARQCNELAIRYYQEVYGVDIFVGGPFSPFLNNGVVVDYPENYDVGDLPDAASGFVHATVPKTGDIVYWSMERRGKDYSHTALVKSYSEGVITLIEQNWTWNGKTAYERKIRFPSDSYVVYTLPDQTAEFVTAGGALFGYNGEGGEVVLPDGVSHVYNVFEGREDVTSVILPSSIRTIGSGAFYGCTGLTNVGMPYGATTIGSYAFYGCENLKAIYLPDTVTKIDAGAFGGCTALETVRMPKSVAYIDPGAFWGCEELNFTGEAGSYAEAYAAEYGLSFNGSVPEKKLVASESSLDVTCYDDVLHFTAYAVTDINGGTTNYVRLRDLALALNDTKAQFEVGYDVASSTISLTTGSGYTAIGSENSTPFSGDRAYKPAANPILLDGYSVELDAITLTDDAGNDYTYFKLRDLGQALGFNVGWSEAQGVFIQPDLPYTDAD